MNDDPLDLDDDVPDDDVSYVARTLSIPREEARRLIENQRNENAEESDP